MTVPAPLTEMERWAQSLSSSDPLGDDLAALCEALRIAVNIASEAVGRLGKITDTYSAVVCSIITEPTAWSHIEYALRGNPPEGAIAFYVLAERLAAVRELVDLGGDDG